ncbi:Flocculation protein FLO11-like [Caenorhabditis elegans]|uniref:Flocculation protein FLO11-like n=1 Tax=Caenorhabditis elegans TaxID=6239 RepID=H8ESG5_CAEEL|nr:Flocculation protein FLO11-like [Caenorhabditis elegans]CCG28136.2 Flocculation protein FLO11-like [Caenorhabditis elegans]|eukprot:NP_001255899.2 Uncharacterized protein CELE_Y43D4A.5 [Caenorhabditis elegans]
MQSFLFPLIISFYLINSTRGSPKTSAETGNDIEKILLEGNSVKGLTPKSRDVSKKPDKFMEDLIEVQRTYRNLKEKWHRMMEEKTQVIQVASELPTSSTTPVTSSNEQKIDIDVFESPDQFEDVSEDFQKTEFDDEAFVDISATSPPATTKSHVASELDEIQAAIQEAFGTTEAPQPSLFEIIGPTTTKRAEQMDATVTSVKVDQTTPSPANIVQGSTTVKPEVPLSGPGKSLLSTFGGGQSVPFQPVRQKVASPWRRKLQIPSESNEVDPFETTTSSPIPVTSAHVPMTSPPEMMTSPAPMTSSTSVPQHILPTSSFVSSGSNPDALPATNLFRYPDQVKIPFYSPTGALQEVTAPIVVARPTTPEPPFRSDEVQNEIEDAKEKVEEDTEEETGREEDEEEEVEASEDDADGDDDDVEEITATTPRGIENNEDYVEETFSKEEIPQSFGIDKAPDFEKLKPTRPRPKAFGIVPSSSGPKDRELGGPGSQEFESALSKFSTESFGNGPAPSGLAQAFPGSFGSPPGSNTGSVSFGSGHVPSDFGSSPSDLAPAAPGSASSQPGLSDGPLSFGSGNAPSEFGPVPSGSFGSPAGSNNGLVSFGSGPATTDPRVAQSSLAPATPTSNGGPVVLSSGQSSTDFGPVQPGLTQASTGSVDSPHAGLSSFGSGHAPSDFRSAQSAQLQASPGSVGSSSNAGPVSFGSGHAPSEFDMAPTKFGSVPSNIPDSSLASPPGSNDGSASFGSGRGPSDFGLAHALPQVPSIGSPPGSASSMVAHTAPGPLKSHRNVESGHAPADFGSGSVEPLGSPPGPQTRPIGTGQPLPPTSVVSDSTSSLGRPAAPAFGIGRAPPGFSEPLGPTLPPAAAPSKPGSHEPFPTLVEQVESFFSDGEEPESGSSSSLGSFGSVEKIADVPVSQSLQVLEDPVHMPTSRNPRGRTPEPIGIFKTTKLKEINERAYKPPMFPSSLSSEIVQMAPLGNPYAQRTTLPPIGPHGLVEPNMEINSSDMELPAWGAVKDHGIMNKARREYQKEFEQQIRDVRMIDAEINRISEINDAGRSKTSQRCSQVYAHTLSLTQIQKMSHSLGLGDVANVIQKASDLIEHPENDIAQLEVDLEEKRKLIAKIEIILSLSESRAMLFDLLNEQKKIAEKMEIHALDLLQRTNFRSATPSPFSAASDISELSTAVRQVLNANSKKGWSMMKRKLQKKSKIPKQFELIDSADVKIKNSFIDFNKKSGHLQETAEIVEPMLAVNQFGRQPVMSHRRPSPLAPPTMSPNRPSQLAAHHLTASKPLAPPSPENESETVHELIDMLHQDIVQLRLKNREKKIRLTEIRPPAEEEKICQQVQCDFEKADLCNFESSHDETTRFKFSKSRQIAARQKRSSQLTDDLLAEPSNIADDLLPYTFRAWSIWAGRRATRQKQIDIGPDFSSHNQHFAAVFLEPQQAGILSIPLILSPVSTKIRLRLFEGTRGIRLRICCDRYCPLETEKGLYRGHRSWMKKTVLCPPNTQMLSFECLNDGTDRGACGVDEIFLDSSRCHHFFNGSDQN